MAVRTIKYTISGSKKTASCLPCSEGKEAYVCLADGTSIQLISNETVFPVEIIDSCTKYKVVGEYIDYHHSKCGGKSYHYPIKVIETETELTLRYNSNLFTDPDAVLSVCDILGITTDICTIKAASIGVGVEVDETTTTLTLGAPTNIGGRTFRYINEEGTITTFVEGFDSVKNAPGCADAGVNASKMVRNVTLNGKELIIDAAPEHTSLVQKGQFGATVLTPNQSVTFTSVVINPSPCRAMAVIAFGFCSAGIFEPPQNVIVGMRMFFNGVSQTTHDPGGYNIGAIINNETFEFALPTVSSNHIILPGGTLTVDLVLDTQDAPFHTQPEVLFEGIHMTIFGSTI